MAGPAEDRAVRDEGAEFAWGHDDFAWRRADVHDVVHAEIGKGDAVDAFGSDEDELHLARHAYVVQGRKRLANHRRDVYAAACNVAKIAALRPPSHPSFIEGKGAVALTSYQAEGASCHRSVKGFI